PVAGLHPAILPPSPGRPVVPPEPPGRSTSEFPWDVGFVPWLTLERLELDRSGTPALPPVTRGFPPNRLVLSLPAPASLRPPANRVARAASCGQSLTGPNRSRCPTGLAAFLAWPGIGRSLRRSDPRFAGPSPSPGGPVWKWGSAS